MPSGPRLPIRHFTAWMGLEKWPGRGKERALAALDSFDSKADPLRLLVSYLLEREK